MRRQLCMPPQQISPSAASRSPWSSAMLHASRNVSAMRRWLPFGSSRQVATPQAESIRTTPSGRTPSSRSRRAMRQAFRHLGQKRSVAAASPMAEPPPVGGQTGATTEPISRFRARTLSARVLS